MSDKDKTMDSGIAERNITILVFSLVGENCALEAKYVQSIVQMPPRITRVPNAPFHVKGVFNLRGNVVPVLDCGLKMGMGEMTQSSDTRVVVAEIEGIQFGFFVDAVREVREIPDTIIEHQSSYGSDVPIEYIEGVAKFDDGRLVVLLDLVSLFDIRELMEEEG